MIFKDKFFRYLVSIYKFFLLPISRSNFLTKAARIAFHKVYKNKGKYFFLELKDFSFIVHRNENISTSIFIDEEFEFTKFQKAIKLAKSKKSYMLVDIGANIGSITIPAIKKKYFKQAIAFEPSEESYKLLKANILINDLYLKVQLEKIALSNSKGFKKLLSNDKYNKGDNKIVSNTSKSPDIELVKTDFLDSYTSKLNKKNSFIKIDVQGHETEILVSSKKTLSKKIPLMIEFEPSNMKKNWSKDFIYIYKFYKFFYDLKQKNPKKQKVDINALRLVHAHYKKINSFTDLLFL